MGIELSGFDDLINDLNNLGTVGNKIGRKAVEEASTIVLDQQIKDAPRSGDDDHAAEKLKVTKIKRYKSGTVVGKIGIDSTNWEDVDHLYYQHYGFEHYKNGERVEPHLGWMTDSFKKVEERAGNAIIEVVNKELDKILK
jgi:hypothetical protein